MPSKLKTHFSLAANVARFVLKVARFVLVGLSDRGRTWPFLADQGCSPFLFSIASLCRQVGSKHGAQI